MQAADDATQKADDAATVIKEHLETIDILGQSSADAQDELDREKTKKSDQPIHLEGRIQQAEDDANELKRTTEQLRSVTNSSQSWDSVHLRAQAPATTTGPSV